MGYVWRQFEAHASNQMCLFNSAEPQIAIKLSKN